MKCEYLMQNSRVCKNKLFNKWPFLIITVMVFLFAAEAKAQMFSVGSAPGRIDIPRTAIYLGLEPADFEYTGGDLESPINEERFEFSGSLLRLRLETTGVELFLATGGSLTGIDDISYFDAGLQAGYGITVFRNKKIIVQIPLQIVSNITSISSDRNLSSSTQFQQGALAIGAGGFVGVRPSNKVRFQAGFVPHYGFSFATGGTFGGSIGKLDGKFRLFLDRLFGEMGLSLGYNYKFDRFDVDENEFDYDLKSHSILIGITF